MLECRTFIQIYFTLQGYLSKGQLVCMPPKTGWSF